MRPESPTLRRDIKKNRPFVSANRITLFKKKIRESLGTPWLRFYTSIGGCHICILCRDFRREDVPQVINRLKSSKVDFFTDSWGWDENSIRSINIPIDQDALPESKRSFSDHSNH